MALRVFLVDEHEVVRRGVAAIIGDDGAMEVVGQADTVRSALLRVPTVKPDVVVVGMLYAVGDGIELCRELVDRAGARVLMLTAETDNDTMVSAFLAGAAGYIDKAISSADLLAAIRSTAGGGTLLNPLAAAAVMHRLRHPVVEAVSPFDSLSPAERDVLNLIGKGLTNRQIAAELGYADKSVKNFVSRILSKMGMSTRTQIAVALVHEQEASSSSPPAPSAN